MKVEQKSFIDDVNQILSFAGNETNTQSDVLSILEPSEFFSIDSKERDLVDRNQFFRTNLNSTFESNEANRFNYNSIQGVRNNRFVTTEFLNGVENMAQRLGTRPEYLLAVMSFESGGTFNPGIRNGIGATGLIQFLPGTARDLGTTTDQLARMSSTEQLQYVEKYFNQSKFQGKLGTLEGLYTAVLSGQARSNSSDVLFRSGTSAYNQNPLDWNQDGQITAGEAVTPVAARMFGGVKAVQKRLVETGFVPNEQIRGFDDGMWGRNTSAVLRRFQEANNLPATGLLGDQTGAKLFGVQIPPNNPPTNLLQRGSRGAAVESLQDNLIKLGFMTEAQKSTGAGIFGPKTESALKAFQQSAKLPVTGTFTAETEQAFRDIKSSLGRTTATKNESVTKGIQDRLVALGYLTREQVNTGYGTFGPRTEDAIKRFQALNGIAQTGQVGETTYQKLFSADAKRAGATNTGTGGYSVATNGEHYTVNPGILMTDVLRPRLDQLANAYFQRTGENLHITSGYRPPARQASAMYDLIVKNGTGHVRNLYSNKTAVDQILTAYRNNSGSRSGAVAAMTGVISDQVGRGTYISDHLRSRALDISTGANFSVLRDLVRGLGGSIINEGDHYHVEL